MTLDPVATTAISVVTSLATAIITIVVRESFDTHHKIGRMLLGLCIDSAGTVRAFENDTAILARGLKRIEESQNSLEDDFAVLRALPNGMIVSPPLALPKELVYLLPTADARKVFLYYDGWERYAELERRYRELFQLILSELAEAKFDVEAKQHYDFLREERFEQLHALVKDLHHTINKLAATCCEILTLAPTYLESSTTESIEVFTGDRWKSWDDVRKSCEHFHKLCNAERSVE